MISSIGSIMSAVGSEGDGLSTAKVSGGVQPIPFQQFLNQAVESLNEVSAVEAGSNLAIDNYLKGQGSLDDAVFAMNELTSTMQLANQVVTTLVTTFREIEQMQI